MHSTGGGVSATQKRTIRSATGEQFFELTAAIASLFARDREHINSKKSIAKNTPGVGIVRDASEVTSGSGSRTL